MFFIWRYEAHRTTHSGAELLKKLKIKAIYSVDAFSSVRSLFLMRGECR
jgi:hypothetical protein